MTFSGHGCTVLIAFDSEEANRVLVDLVRNALPAGLTTTSIGHTLDHTPTRSRPAAVARSLPQIESCPGSVAYRSDVLPESDLARVRRSVEARNERLPGRPLRQIRYELDVADRFVTIFECRPPWRPDYGPDWTRVPIVRFHYRSSRREWATFWRDRNSKFHRFDPSPPSPQIDVLLTAVDEDRSAIFWG